MLLMSHNVETVHQQCAGVINTIMKDVQPKLEKAGSHFHWDFETGTWLENKAANQACGKQLEEKRKQYLKTKGA